MSYVIVKDFFESRTAAYTFRQFWSEEKKGWRPFADATRYPEPKRINPEDPHETCIEVT